MKCPACNSIAHKKINGGGIKQYLHLDLLPKTFQLLQCENCALVFKDHIPDNDQLQKYYATISEDQWDHVEVYPHEAKISQHLRTIPAGSRVLDIGCGPGIMLGKFTSHHACFGIEANSGASSLAKKRGINIISPWISADINSVEKFDCIILIDVFEHLSAPFEIVELAFTRLRAGGKLFIVTGSTDCLPYWLLGPHYWYFKISQHIVFLNQRHLNWVQKKLPNSALKFTKIGHYQSSFGSFIRSSIKLLKWSMETKLRRALGFGLKQVPFEILRDFKDHYFIEITNTKTEN